MPSTSKPVGPVHRLWRSVAVRLFGGFGELGPIYACVHDDGFSAGWRRIQKVDLRFAPATPVRCVMRLAEDEKRPVPGLRPAGNDAPGHGDGTKPASPAGAGG